MAWSAEQRDKAAQTRQMNKEKRAAEKIQSTGVGESRIFAAPEGTFAENPVLNCHVGGVLVRDLPIASQGRILYQQTDEGIEEYNKTHAQYSDGTPAVGFFARDEVKTACSERKDDLVQRGMEPYEAKDILKETAGKYAKPGMSQKFLSPQTVQKRGTRGFEPVLENGEPVKVGNLILAEMPKEKAKQRNEYYRSMGNKRLSDVKREYMDSGGQSAVSD